MSVYAPYNFVPLSGFVHLPDWAEQVSRDLPFRDGISGRLDLTLTNHTPMLVGGRQTDSSEKKAGDVFFARDINDRPFIPGAGLKGLLRNVVEIASFGRFAAVDDRRLSIRDLTGGVAEVYRKHINKSTGFGPKSKAGWLNLVKDGDNSRWELTPCRHVRVEHHDLIQHGKRIGAAKPHDIKKRGNAVEKYKSWGRADLEVAFNLPPKTRDPGKGATPKWEIAMDLGVGAWEGRIVFTGQPQDNDGVKRGRSKPKHLEFIFYEEGEPFFVDDQVMRGFLDIHSEGDEWQKLWKARLGSKPGVPVFYITESEAQLDQRVRALGLARMFRLAYKHSIGETAHHTNSDHLGNRPDLADLIFGALETKHGGYQGRLNITAGRLEGEPHFAEPQEVLLNGPKPSYFPAYIRQPDADDQGNVDRQGHFHTYMDDDAEVAGWKRYPVRDRVNYEMPHHELEAKTKKPFVMLHPLKAGHRFRASLFVHNLRPVELGALLWALDFGGSNHLRHGLGMGKPFGQGALSIKLDDCELTANQPDGATPQPEQCRLAFEAHMDQVWRAAAKDPGDHHWSQSEQIRQLRAMADPALSNPERVKLAYMPLPQFQNSKGRRKGDRRYSLPPYTPFKGPDDHRLFPRLTPAERAAEARRQEKEAALAAEALKLQEEAAAREQAMAGLSPLERQLTLDLEGPKAMENAGLWVQKLEHHEDAAVVAVALRDFFQSIGKWDKKQSPKQQKKINRIKQYLPRE